MKCIYKTLFLSLFTLGNTGAFSQAQKPVSAGPRLVVGIVVDQMRNDYIYRYWDRFGEGGFKRLVNGGYYFRNAHYNYIPTFTGPGHCSIYTGSTPRSHGIIANEWHIKGTRKSTNCVKDTSVVSVGTTNKSGIASPKNQLSSTIGDELKMSSNKKGKVFSVALKDRSAILPSGHAADGAFWMDEETGNFISSSWYMQNLPVWVTAFNQKKLAFTYLQQGWETLKKIETYTASIADDNRYEGTPYKKDKPVFNYEYKSFLDKNDPGILRSTPYGNSITKDIGIACIKNEQLGKDNIADLFCISFSCTDIVAHTYGPRAVEVEDVYLRLDKDIEELLACLDKEVGKNNYVVFLTADHGGADVPNHLLDTKIPAGYASEKTIAKDLRAFCMSSFGDSLLIENVSNEQVFLNDKKLAELNLDKDNAEEKIAAYLLTYAGIAEVYTAETLRNSSFAKNDYRALLQNGFNHRLSGNIAYMYQPGWMNYGDKGTTHGAGYNYDTHVPIIFYGNGIKKGESFDYTTITQIAPTVCELLKINQPNSCSSQPLNGFFK